MVLQVWVASIMETLMNNGCDHCASPGAGSLSDQDKSLPDQLEDLSHPARVSFGWEGDNDIPICSAGWTSEGV
jgi:hypothetical protein